MAISSLEASTTGCPEGWELGCSLTFLFILQGRQEGPLQAALLDLTANPRQTLQAAAAAQPRDLEGWG